MTKVAVIGSTGWQNKRKVQQTLQELKKKFQDAIWIRLFLFQKIQWKVL